MIGNISPPFGLLLFIIKDVMPDVPMKAIYKSIVAIFVIQIIAIIMFMVIPEFITWLPYMGRASSG